MRKSTGNIRDCYDFFNYFVECQILPDGFVSVKHGKGDAGTVKFIDDLGLTRSAVLGHKGDLHLSRTRHHQLCGFVLTRKYKLNYKLRIKKLLFWTSRKFCVADICIKIVKRVLLMI